MPYSSTKQRAYLHAKKPKLAKKWDKKYSGKVKKKKDVAMEAVKKATAQAY